MNSQVPNVAVIPPLLLLMVVCGEDSGPLLSVSVGDTRDSELFVKFPPIPNRGTGRSQDIIEIENVGMGPLTIAELEAVYDIHGHIRANPPLRPAPFELDPGESLSLEFELRMPVIGTPQSRLECPSPPAEFPGSGPYCGHVTISSRDSTTRVFFLARSSAGFLEVAPDSVHFEGTRVGRTVIKDLKLKNTARDAILYVESFQKDIASGMGDRLSLNGFPLPLSLQPGDSEAFALAFTPDNAEPLEGKILIRSNDQVNPIFEISVRSEGARP